MSRESFDGFGNEVPPPRETLPRVTITKNLSSDAKPPLVTYEIELRFSLNKPFTDEQAFHAHNVVDGLTATGMSRDARDPAPRYGYRVRTRRAAIALTPLDIAQEMQMLLRRYASERGVGYPMFHGISVQEILVTP